MDVHLDGEEGVGGGISHITRGSKINAEADDSAVESNNDREDTSLGGGDCVLKLKKNSAHCERCSCSVLRGVCSR